MPGGRAAGSLTWAGLANTYFWIDHETGVCALILTQILPFFDAGAASLYSEYERTLYDTLAARPRT